MPRGCTCTGAIGVYCEWCTAMLELNNRTHAHITARQPTMPQVETSTPKARVDTKESNLVASRALKLDTYQSKTERRFAIEVLGIQQADGLVTWWRYEPFSLRLAPRLHYRPDFLVQTYAYPHEALILYEVKGGFIRDRSMHKVKMAAALFPMFTVVLAQYTQGFWHYKEIPAV